MTDVDWKRAANLAGFWDVGVMSIEEDAKAAPLGIAWGRYDCRQPRVATLLVRGDITVRTSVPSDWPFLNDLGKLASYAIGFLPQRTWHDYVWGGERNFIGVICEVGGWPAGFLLWTPGHHGAPVRLQQIAVRPDARRLEYGLAMVDVAESFASDYGRSGLRLRCRLDLADAQAFWRALGFEVLSVQPKGSLNHMGWTATNDIVRYWRAVAGTPTLWSAV